MSGKATEKERKNLIHPVRTRVNKETYQRLESLLQNSTWQSMGELARKLITREKINCFYKDVTMNAPMEELTSIRKELKQLEKEWPLEYKGYATSWPNLSLKNNNNMNLNNLMDLKDEMKKLGFGEAHIEKMEEHMRANEPNFKLYDEVKASRGQVDITLHFKQSGQSEYCYLNRLEAVHNLAKPLEEAQKYLIITHTPEGQENGVKKMENFNEAVVYFKKQSGNVELALDKNAASKTMLANMENGKINYVARDFDRSFKSPPMPQIFWRNHGEGFGREHAANLVQGRSVYRNDLLNRDGVPYNACVQLDTDKER